MLQPADVVDRRYANVADRRLATALIVEDRSDEDGLDPHRRWLHNCVSSLLHVVIVTGTCRCQAGFGTRAIVGSSRLVRLRLRARRLQHSELRPRRPPDGTPFALEPKRTRHASGPRFTGFIAGRSPAAAFSREEDGMQVKHWHVDLHISRLDREFEDAFRAGRGGVGEEVARAVFEPLVVAEEKRTWRAGQRFGSGADSGTASLSFSSIARRSLTHR
ncbi:hypothetical protein ACWEOE_34840 [Amycolatopsis sp. NPDC004368]